MFARLMLVLATLLAAQVAFPAAAAELVMFDARWCGYCKRFHKEVGAEGYKASAAARSFPLRVLDVDRERPQFRLKQPVNGTPTFVLVEGDREIARFSGYGGRSEFLRTVASLAAEYEAGRAAAPKARVAR